MREDMKIHADCAAAGLDTLLARATEETASVFRDGGLVRAATYFSELRDMVTDLAARVSELEKHVQLLSYELLPNMFDAQGVKTLKLNDVGQVTVNVRWSARMLDKQSGMNWLRETGNEGMIVETVNAQSLGAFAKAETLEGRPLPSEIFKVSTAPYVSVTKG